MLSDVFSDLLPEGKEVRSPTVWESSRFSVLHEPNDGGHMVTSRSARISCTS
jgi:N-acyl-L-homoserine lactone synthetase